jgi:ATP-dependent RNA circularization protein (DNA/RNA ligase family)
MGPGIQGNREGFKDHKFFVFDIFNIKEHKYLDPKTRIGCLKSMFEFGLDPAVEGVPVLGEDWRAPASVDEGLAIAEGPSINHPIREGLVWKCNEDPNFSFKTISNKFLLKGGD